MNILITAGGAPAFYSIYNLINKKYANSKIFSCDVDDHNVGRNLSEKFFYSSGW
jgi:hypothetical protein